MTRARRYNDLDQSRKCNAVSDRKEEPSDLSESNRLADSLVKRVQQVKVDHPEISASIDATEQRIQGLMETMRDVVRMLPEKKDRDLMTVLVINEVHRCVESLLT